MGLLVFATAFGSGSTSLITQDEADYGVLAAPPLPIAVPVTSFDPATDIADLDGSTVVTTSGGQLRFAEHGAEMLVSVGVNAELRAVSATGTRAALFERVDATTSRITVVERNGAESVVEIYDLQGLVEPEAFSTDGRVLYVIDHQITETRGSYRVRPLNLETGLLENILGPTKALLEDDMNGTGRRQVWSPDGGRLYTLYIRQTHHHHRDGDHGHGEAGSDGFVHVLDLNEEWAVCLDLPPAFGNGDLATTALAITPDGRTIVVADANAGQVAFASTAGLVISRTATLPELEIEGDLHIGMIHSDFAIGFGSEVHWFDQQTMTPVSEEPALLYAPLIAITSDGSTILAWTTNKNRGPVSLPAPAT